MRKKTPKDRFIGERLKVIRECTGISRKELAKEIDLSAQQIQKYENGSNRIAVSTLLKISEALNVPIWDFVEDENGNLIDSQEQRALYYWRSLNHPTLQNGFIDLMQSVSDTRTNVKRREQV